MPQHKQFMLCHILLKDKIVRGWLCHGKIQQSKFSSPVQSEDRESQKFSKEIGVTDKELNENGVCSMNSVGSYERRIFYLSGLTYPKHFTFLRILMLLQTEQDCLHKDWRV